MITIRNLTLLAALFLWACTGAPTIKDAESVAPDSRIVFGSVEVWSGDEQETWGTKWLGHNYFFLMILPPNTAEAITYQLDKDGTFCWALEPGEYKLLGYYWLDEDLQRTGGIGTTFEVPAAGGDVYFGTIVFRAIGPYLLPLFEDRFDVNAAQYNAKCPVRRGTTVKRLLEPAEPVGSSAATRAECDEAWNIEFDKRYRGVTPISPKSNPIRVPDHRITHTRISLEALSETGCQL